MEDNVPCIPTAQQWMLWVALIVSTENKFAPKVSQVIFFLERNEIYSVFRAVTNKMYSLTLKADHFIDFHSVYTVEILPYKNSDT